MQQLDVPAPNAFAATAQWLDGTVLGTVATMVAILAVSSVGFLLLQGRADMRRATQVIFGCFIVFGASSISAGIVRALMGPTDQSQMPIAAPMPPPEPHATTLSTVKASPYNPYASVALPTR